MLSLAQILVVSQSLNTFQGKIDFNEYIWRRSASRVSEELYQANIYLWILKVELA